jgi:hypothetical protein
MQEALQASEKNKPSTRKHAPSKLTATQRLRRLRFDASRRAASDVEMHCGGLAEALSPDSHLRDLAEPELTGTR